MDLIVNLTIRIMLLLVFFPIFASADTIILKTGEAIETKKAWEQGDKIFFNLHGQALSVLKKDVQQIKRTKLDQKDSSQNPRKKKTVLTTKKYETRSKDVFRNEKQQKTLSPRSSIEYKKVEKRINLNGFSGLRWGEKVSSVEGLEKIDKEPSLDGVIECFRPDDVLILGKAELKSIVYSFWNDKLYTVTIWTQGHFNYFALRKEIFKQFGEGSKSDKHRERYIWSEGQTDGMLEYIENGEYGLLWIRSKELDRQLKLSELSGPLTYLKHIKSKDYKKPNALETGQSK